MFSPQRPQQMGLMQQQQESHSYQAFIDHFNNQPRQHHQRHNLRQGAFNQSAQQQQQSAFFQPAQNQQQSAFSQPAQQQHQSAFRPRQNVSQQFAQQQQGAFQQSSQQQHRSAFQQPNQQHRSAFQQPSQQHRSAFQQSNQQLRSAFQQPNQQHRSTSQHSDQPPQRRAKVNHSHRMNNGPQQNAFQNNSVFAGSQQPQHPKTYKPRQAQASAFNQKASPFQKHRPQHYQQQSMLAQAMDEDMAPQRQSRFVPAMDEGMLKPEHIPQELTVDQVMDVEMDRPAPPQQLPKSNQKMLPKMIKPAPPSPSPQQKMSKFTQNTPQKTIKPMPPQQQPSVKKASVPQDRAKRFGATAKSSLYDQYKKDRVREREQAIRDGLIPDPANPTRLEDAIDFRGTCKDKCPEFEMIEREIQNGLDSLEMDEDGNADPNKVVKAYRRSAAGNDQPLPSDVRSPAALVATLDYLIDEVLSNHPLERCHAFIRDRTRSIRQDFTLQNIRDETAVHVHERIARFHILCLHEMCEFDESRFSEQQETEQLRKVLLSLMEFYDDLREEGIETENEAEFRAYHLLTHIRDQDLLRQAQTLPIHVFSHPYMKRALEFHALAQRNNEIMETSSRKNKFLNVEASQNNYAGFFQLIADKNTPFLMACLLETLFADVRKGALKAMNRSYMAKAGGVEAEDVRRVLAYDTLSHLLKEANLYGLVVEMSDNKPTIAFGQKHYRTKQAVFREPLSNPSQRKSLTLVEPKKVGRTFKQIINSDPIDTDNLMAATVPSLPVTITQPREVQQPVEINVKYTELTGSPPRHATASVQDADGQQIDNSEKEELKKRLSDQVQMMEAQLRREKQRIAELTRKQEEQARFKREQEEKVKKEQERQRQERLQREAAAAKEIGRELKEEQARKVAAIQKEVEIQAAKEKLAAELRQKALLSKTVNRLRNTLIEEVIADLAAERVKKIVRARQFIRWRMKSKLMHVRERIAKRNSNISRWRKKWKQQHDSALLLDNPYSTLKKEIVKARGLQLTAQQMQDRIDYSVELEEIAQEMYEAKPAESKENHLASIWQTEEFSFNNIYPRINDKLDLYKEQFKAITGALTEDGRIDWEVLIHVADTQLESSAWYKSKFGLDNSTLQRCDRYIDCSIRYKMITADDKTTLNTKAIIFSLPETGDYTEEYWKLCRAQLRVLTGNLIHEVPIVISFFANYTEPKQIPLLLQLNDLPIKDFHLLIMTPSTIPQRVVEAVNWLASMA